MIVSVLFGLYNTLHSWLKMHYQEWRTELTESRIANTEKLVTATDQQLFITRKVLPLLKYICETPDVDLEQTQLYYLTKYDLDLSLYLFDKNGNLEHTVPKNAPNQWLMKNLFPYLLEKDFKKIETGSQQLDKKIEFTFGYGKNLISLRDNPEIIINSVSGDQECFFAWSARKGKSIFIFGHRLPSDEKIVNSVYSYFPKNSNLLSVGKISDKPEKEQDLIALEAKKYLSNKSLDHGIYNNKEWYFSSNKNGKQYYTVYKTASNIYSRAIVFLKYIIFIILLIYFIFLRFSININLSLKQMIILIFLASSMIPIGNLSSESFENIETYSEIYKNELKSSMEEIINNSIQNFENYLTLCSNKLKKYTEPQNGVYDLEKAERNITLSFPDSKFSLRNAACDIIYSNQPPSSSGRNTLFKAIGRICIKKYRPERLDELPYNGNQFAEEMVSREDLGFANLTDKPNQLQFIYNNGIKMLLFLKLLPKEAGQAAILYTELNIQNTLNQYLKSIDKRTLVLNQQQISLYALNPNGYRWIIPPKTYNSTFLEQAESAYITGKPILRKIKEKNNIFYSLCISNSEYLDVCYLGLISIDKLEKEISKKKTIICICVIIALFLFSVITTWIMRQLIKPLTDLEKGIIALDKRNYETQIDVPHGKDEFVQLFKEFNHMMGENYDMQMAKNVQEGIITTAFPKVDNFLISGCTYPIDKLNSNCLTSFKMPDDKILFTIGNITGTSIGSALMMAFIRSITFHWSQKTRDNPVSLIEAIEQMFKTNKTKNMYIGLICGIFDSKNGKIKFVTRGQVFPLFLRQNKKLEWIGQPSLPIGINKKVETRLLESQILPGERLLCLTNGLIEFNSSNDTTAYELVEQWAVQTSSKDEEKWLENIKKRYDDYCTFSGSKPTGDITLFSIISNNSEGRQA